MIINLEKRMTRKRIVGAAILGLAAYTTNGYAEDVQLKIKDGLKIQSADRDFAFRLGGRLQFDSAWYDDDNTALGDGTELRRARLFVSGALFRDWGFRAEYDFAGNSVSAKGVWLGYSGFRSISLKVGNIQEPFSLEELTSSNYITFMERALPSTFVPGYHLGAVVKSSGESWSAAAGIFGDTVGKHTTGVDEGWGTAARVTFTPIHGHRRVLHIGAGAEHREPDGNRQVRYRTRPESHITNRRLVDTGNIKDVDDTTTYGLEAATVRGPLSLQGEYMLANINRRGLANLSFHGGYVYGSWFLTGESRRYSVRKGGFQSIKPKAKSGAWELGMRYSTIDLTDGDITGGKENDVTLGLNWYPNTNMRFMLNYIMVDANPNRHGVDENPNILQLRAQVHF